MVEYYRIAMNIFYLDKNPRKAAEYHCDKHVVKMILESAQLLSTAHHVLSNEDYCEGLYKKTHTNHPCAIWVRESKANYEWLYQLYLGLLEEYTLRYGKTHKSGSLADQLELCPDDIDCSLPFTDPPLCMPEHVQIAGDPVGSYRLYYKTHKAYMATWGFGPEPVWWKEKD